MNEPRTWFLFAMIMLVGFSLSVIIFSWVRSAWRRRASRVAVRVSGVGPHVPQAQTKPRMEGLTGRERLVVWHLAEAWNTWCRLEGREDYDSDEMMSLINGAQALVGMRVAVRANPEFWRQPARRAGKTAAAAASARDGDVHLRPGSNPPPPRPSTKVSPNSPWPPAPPRCMSGVQAPVDARACLADAVIRKMTAETDAKMQASAAPNAPREPGRPYLTNRELWLMFKAWAAVGVTPGSFDQWVSEGASPMAARAPGGPAENLTYRERILMRAAWDAWQTTTARFDIWITEPVFDLVNGRQVGSGISRAEYLSKAVAGA